MWSRWSTGVENMKYMYQREMIYGCSGNCEYGYPCADIYIYSGDCGYEAWDDISPIPYIKLCRFNHTEVTLSLLWYQRLIA